MVLKPYFGYIQWICTIDFRQGSWDRQNTKHGEVLDETIILLSVDGTRQLETDREIAFGGT